jgi:hypothetical protein
MLITSLDVNVEVLNVSSEMMMMIIIIIITSAILAGYLKRPKGGALHLLPIIAIMNWHVFYFFIF